MSFAANHPANRDQAKVMNRFDITKRMVARLKHDEAVVAGIKGCEAMRFEWIEVHPVADRVAFTFHITLNLEGGSTMHIRGVEIFTVTDDGLISSVEAYWGQDDVTLEEVA